MEGDVCICYISLKNKGKIKLEENGKFLKSNILLLLKPKKRNTYLILSVAIAMMELHSFFTIVKV